MTSGRKRWFLLLMLLFFVFPVPFPALSACAEEPVHDVNHFNLVLVVDKSGSLCCENETGTDPDGLRYDALRLFLGLLTEKGNQVGTIVFDEFIRYESPVEPLGGMEERKALIKKIEEYYPCNDTDIGRAVLRAVEELRDISAADPDTSASSPKSLVLLFSDGKTDFTVGDGQTKMRNSFAKADEAVAIARQEGITVSGILLNADDISDRGDDEYRLYAAGTKGVFETVRKPEDLSNAFLRLYEIINNIPYTGAQRIAFSDEGEAELFFTVPSFGVEEVNVIVEGSRFSSIAEEGDLDIQVLRPDGTSFDCTGHVLECAGRRLVKIPEPQLGVWTVRLRGEPEDRADITMVCNASLSVSLRAEKTEEYRTLVPYTFAAMVKDPKVPSLAPAQLEELSAVLTCEELATGAVREYPLQLQYGLFLLEQPLSFPRPGEYRLCATVGFGDFKVSSEVQEFSVAAAPLVPKVESVTDPCALGQFLEDTWILDLDDLFGVGKTGDVQYTLSDDYAGALTVENGMLRVPLAPFQPYSFTLTAVDPLEQSAKVSFDLLFPAVSARIRDVSDVLTMGRFKDDLWEIPLDELFDDPKALPLEYALSYDSAGSVLLEDGLLRARLEDGAPPLYFTLTATDRTGQQAAVHFELSVPCVTASSPEIRSILSAGRLQDFVWELPLEGLFTSSGDLPLTYSLSGDCDGAVRLEDGLLTVDFHELREAGFQLTAVNSIGRQAEIAFSLSVPGPSVSPAGITETVKTGLFQKKSWDVPLGSVFRDPKGTRLTYTLLGESGDAQITDSDVLHIETKSLGKLSFSVQAQDEYGLTAELPVSLAGRNMTLVYLLWTLLALLLIGAAAGGIIYLRRR